MSRKFFAPARTAFVSLSAIVLVLGVTLFSPGCGDDDDDDGDGGGNSEVPEAWGGVWSITTTNKDCVTHEVIDTDTSDEVFCPGEPITFDEGGEEITCDGTVTDTTIDVTCTNTFTIEGVEYVVTVTLQATRTGDTFVGTGHLTVTSGGDQISCQDFDLEASRTGPAPSDCASTRSFVENRVDQLLGEGFEVR